MMNTDRQCGKVLHGLGSVSDEADIACNLLCQVKRNSLNKAVQNENKTDWRRVCMDTVCSPREQISEKNGPFLSPRALSIVSWIDCVRDTTLVFSKKDAQFQPFQNLVVMDFLFYLIQRVCPTELDDIIHHRKRTLGLHDVTTEEIRNMKKRYSFKHSVYIVPRRHGKTSFFVALIGIAILFVENIIIGYGCHRKSALKEAYEHSKNVVQNTKYKKKKNELQNVKVSFEKGEKISTHNEDSESRSWILFIILQNDKVRLI